MFGNNRTSATTKFTVLLALLFSIIAVEGCASSGQGSGGEEKLTEAPSLPIPPESPLAKVKVGMSWKQARDLIGEPTEQGGQWTGKHLIPLYTGNDAFRVMARYKGMGRVYYTAKDERVFQVEYDPSESGYRLAPEK